MTDDESEDENPLAEDNEEADSAEHPAIDDKGHPSRDLFDTLKTLPLFDNPFLAMQARNIAIVDAHVRDLEHQMMRAYDEDPNDRTPIVEMTIVSALSQVWIFGFYELLRTWRQAARQLIEYAKELTPIRGATDYEEKRAALSARHRKTSKGPPHSQAFAEQIYGRPYRRIEEEPHFAAVLEGALEAVQRVMRRIEELRVALAKHEVRGARGVPAYAPGYARIDHLDSCLVWTVEKKNGYSEMISRRSLADGLREAVRLWRASHSRNSRTTKPRDDGE